MTATVPLVSDRRVRRRHLAGSAGLVAFSAAFGAAGLAFGFLGFPDRLVRRLPFGSSVVAGAALALIIAVPYSALAGAAWSGDRRTAAACVGCGLLMVGWIAVEVFVVRELSFLQPLMAIVGLAFVVTGWKRRTRHRDE